MNAVTLIGRAAGEPEIRETSSGLKIATFALAVQRFGKDKGADFIEVSCFDKTADIVERFVRKGDQVGVEGRLQQDSWEDKKTGQRRSKIKVSVRQVHLLQPKRQEPGSQVQGFADEFGAAPSEVW